MELIEMYATEIFSLTIGGVSLVSIISLAIYLVKAMIKNRNEIGVTKQQIEDAFKSVILPKNIKLDVSKKIQEPIKAGLATIQIYLSDALEKVATGERLILSILSKFSHIDKLTPEEREELADFLEKGITKDEELV